MDKKVYDNYVKLLHDELTMATGCTEPIAIAYAGAKLREVLGDIPEYGILQREHREKRHGRHRPELGRRARH